MKRAGLQKTPGREKKMRRSRSERWTPSSHAALALTRELADCSYLTINVLGTIQNTVLLGYRLERDQSKVITL